MLVCTTTPVALRIARRVVADSGRRNAMAASMPSGLMVPARTSAWAETMARFTASRPSAPTSSAKRARSSSVRGMRRRGSSLVAIVPPGRVLMRPNLSGRSDNPAQQRFSCPSPLRRTHGSSDPPWRVAPSRGGEPTRPEEGPTTTHARSPPARGALRLAEADRNRTCQTEMLGFTGFEDRGAHQEPGRLPWCVSIIGALESWVRRGDGRAGSARRTRRGRCQGYGVGSDAWNRFV